MTEEIIIDGVNVAWCEHNYVVSNKPYCGVDYEYIHNGCEKYPDCYYKQLQRLKQENETLTRENERLAETPQWRQIKDMANNNRYRKALEGIREYVINHPAPRKDRVINKINEVLK